MLSKVVLRTSRLAYPRSMAVRALSVPRAVGQQRPAQDPTVRNYVTAGILVAWVSGVYFFSIFKIKGAV